MAAVADICLAANVMAVVDSVWRSNLTLSFFLNDERKDFVYTGKRFHEKYLTSDLSIGIIEPHKKGHDVLLSIIRVHLTNASTSALTTGASL